MKDLVHPGKEKNLLYGVAVGGSGYKNLRNARFLGRKGRSDVLSSVECGQLAADFSKAAGVRFGK
jgi:hypothetical protein